MAQSPAICDATLLKDFVESASDDAFRQLVARYAGLVRASARRQLRHDAAHLADDVTQAVFIVLARRAKVIDPVALPAWLIKTTYFAAKDALRMEARRRAYERKAAAMNPATTSSDPSAAAAADVAPVIDRALMRLGTIDRSIVTLHFLKEQSVEEVAAAVGSTVAAVRKRIARALPKLRESLSRQGALLSAVALPLVLESFKPD